MWIIGEYGILWFVELGKIGSASFMHPSESPNSDFFFSGLPKHSEHAWELKSHRNIKYSRSSLSSVIEINPIYSHVTADKYNNDASSSIMPCRIS